MVITCKVAPASAWIMRRMGYLPHASDCPISLAGRLSYPKFFRRKPPGQSGRRPGQGFMRTRPAPRPSHSPTSTFTSQGTAARAAEAVLQCLS